MKIGRFYLKLCLKNSPKFWQAFLWGIMSYSWVAADLYIGGTTSPINHSRQLCGFYYLPGLETSAFGSPAPPFPRNDQLQEEKGKGDLCESWRERFSSGNIWEEVDVLSERRWTVIQSDVLHQVSDWWKYCWIRKRLYLITNIIMTVNVIVTMLSLYEFESRFCSRTLTENVPSVTSDEKKLLYSVWLH